MAPANLKATVHFSEIPCTSRLLMVTGSVAELEAVPKAVASAGPMFAEIKDYTKEIGKSGDWSESGPFKLK